MEKLVFATIPNPGAFECSHVRIDMENGTYTFGTCSIGIWTVEKDRIIGVPRAAIITLIKWAKESGLRRVEI